MGKEKELHFRRKLLDRRRWILQERQNHENAWRQSNQPEIEFEETAGKAQAARRFDRLENQEKNEIEAIDAALGRLETGDFGTCQRCAGPISEQRLEAVPWTSLCISCAEEVESGPYPPEKNLEMEENIEIEPEEQSSVAELSDTEIVDLVNEELRLDKRVEFEEVTVSSKNGLLRLQGVLPSENKHEILLSIVQDTLGINDFIDEIRIDPIAWERQDRTSGKKKAGRTEEEIRFEGEGADEDVHNARQTGTSVSPPDEIIPEKE